jgi:hypothetical protein
MKLINKNINSILLSIISGIILASCSANTDVKEEKKSSEELKLITINTKFLDFVTSDEISNDTLDIYKEDYIKLESEFTDIRNKIVKSSDTKIEEAIQKAKLEELEKLLKSIKNKVVVIEDLKK